MAGGKGKIEPGDGRKFSSSNQPANRGRKPKLFSHLSSEFKARGLEEATPERVREIYQYLLALTLPEVIEIAGKDDDPENDYPAVMRLAAKEMIGKRAKEIVDTMLDRAHGRATQPVSVENYKPVYYQLPDGTIIEM